METEKEKKRKKVKKSPIGLKNNKKLNEEYTITCLKKCNTEIENYGQMLLNCFSSYSSKPAWYKIQTMFTLCFQLGYEYGRKSIFENDLLETKKGGK